MDYLTTPQHYPYIRQAPIENAANSTDTMCFVKRMRQNRKEFLNFIQKNSFQRTTYINSQPKHPCTWPIPHVARFISIVDTTSAALPKSQKQIEL